MAEPPLAAPALQISPRSVALRWFVSSAKLTGASGASIMVAPSPVAEVLELPLALVATTFALMLVPKVKE